MQSAASCWKNKNKLIPTTRRGVQHPRGKVNTQDLKGLVRTFPSSLARTKSLLKCLDYSPKKGTRGCARASTYQRTRRSYQKSLCIKTERRDRYWQTHKNLHKLEEKKVCLPRNAKMTLFQQGSGAIVTGRAQSHSASRHDSLGDCACGLAHELQVCAPTFFFFSNSLLHDDLQLGTAW